MKSLLSLFCFFLIIVNTKEDYTFETLFNYLEDEGFLPILEEIKINLGYDIAISMCKEIVKTNQCEAIMKSFNRSGSRPFQHGEDNINNKNLEEILFEEKNLQILKKKFNKIEIKKIIQKIEMIYN